MIDVRVDKDKEGNPFVEIGNVPLDDAIEYLKALFAPPSAKNHPGPPKHVYIKKNGLVS